MKYLMINGSPRRGNTWKVVKEVEKELKKIDLEAEFKEIHLIEREIPFCTGCSTCFRKGNNYCPHNKYISDIIKDIDKSDAVIISSTAFTSKETSLLRNLFNHFEYMVHRPHFFLKKALVVTSTSGIGAKPVSKSISKFLNLIGFNKCYRLPVKTYSWNNFILNKEVSNKCTKISKKLYLDIYNDKKHSPTMNSLFWYNLFRGTSIFLGKESKYPTEDGVFWLEKNRVKYAYDSDIKVSLLKRCFGQIVYGVGKVVGRFLVVTYK